MENYGNYSNTDILNLLYLHGECGKIASRTCRLFNERYPHLPRMNITKFRRMKSNFIRHGKTSTVKIYNKPVTGTEDNEVSVLAYYHAYPHSSIRSASQDLGLSFSSVQRILNNHKMHNYSFTTVQALREGDDLRRIDYCERFLVQSQEDPHFPQKIIWTDESKFSREGIINRKNWHYWAAENPHWKREANFQDGFSFNVFAILMDNRVRYTVYDENLTSEKYIQILRENVTDFLDELPLNVYNNCWYQMDGAPAHSSRDVYLELTRMFQDRWIGPNGPWPWPPRSPDLTPLDFYLWGYIKNKVYSTPVHSREELLQRVRTAFAELDGTQVRNATANGVPSRVIQCLEQNGNHIEHL